MIYDHLAQPPGTFCFAPLVWNPVQEKCTTVEQAIADAKGKIPFDPKVLETVLKTQPAPSSSGDTGVGWVAVAAVVGIGILVWSMS